MPRGRPGTTPAGTIPAVLGIDLGTSEAKVALVGLDGALLGLGRAGYATSTGPDGRAEQDPRDWWRAIAAAVRSIDGLDRAEILAIACVGQGPTLVAIEQSGEPVRAAVTWQDRRPGESGFGLLPRMAWLAETDPDAPATARWLLSAWDAVGLWLSGEAAWTVQAHEARPSRAELEAAGISDDRVPPEVAFGTRLGGLRPQVAASLGLPTGTPVVAGVNDGTASMLGAGLLQAGDAVDTGGVSGGLGIYTDRHVSVPGLFAAPAPLPELWVVGGAMAALGASVDWLRGPVLGGRWSMDELLREAARIAPGANGLLFLPYLAGERAPVFDNEARGAFVGLTLAHGPADLVRAVLEGAAFAMRSVAEPLAEAGAPIHELRLAGKADPVDTWAQIKAHVLGVPVAVPEVGETAAVGAAIVAAVGVGSVPSLWEGVQLVTGRVRWSYPDSRHQARYEAAYARYLQLYPALRDA